MLTLIGSSTEKDAITDSSQWEGGRARRSNTTQNQGGVCSIHPSVQSKARQDYRKLVGAETREYIVRKSGAVQHSCVLFPLSRHERLLRNHTHKSQD